MSNEAIAASKARIKSVEAFNGHLPSSPALAVVPTYNERENIVELLPALTALEPPMDVLVADDGSPDGTAEAVAALAPRLSRRVYLMRRTGKFGLGVCYLDAFKWTFETSLPYRVIVQMDADFSHDPNMVPILIERAQAYGATVGSRYVEGGSTPDWNHRRVFLSKAGNWYARNVLRLFFPSYPVRDNTAGFIAWRADVLSSVLRQPIMGDGYAFLTAQKLVAFRLGFPPSEAPIVFRDRRLGVSKLNRHIIFEAILMPWRLGWRFRKPVVNNGAMEQ